MPADILHVSLDSYVITKAFELAEEKARAICSECDASDFYLEVSLVTAELQTKSFGELRRWIFTFTYSTEGTYDKEADV
jgi:hypothetical protein